MSVHEDIVAAIHLILEGMPGPISPTTVALRLVRHFGPQQEIHLAWLTLEQAKAMVRRVLADAFDPTRPATVEGGLFGGDDGEVFGTRMQAWYPLPHRRGEVALWERKERLSYEQLMWVAAQLAKAERGLSLHRLEVEAYAARLRPTPDAA